MQIKRVEGVHAVAGESPPDAGAKPQVDEPTWINKTKLPEYLDAGTMAYAPWLFSSKMALGAGDGLTVGCGCGQLTKCHH